MKTFIGALVNTTFLVAILAPVSLAIIWLLLSSLHASQVVLYSGEAITLLPIAILTGLLFKNALKVEGELRAASIG